MRIDKFLAHTGFGTRSEVKQLIKSKMVMVNEVVCINKNAKIDIYKDVVKVRGEVITYKEYYYVMMNKPKDHVSATKDNLHKTVIDVLDETYQNRNLKLIGRLDKDTTGLMLLSNDGRFVHKITSPKKDIFKTYVATINGEITDDGLKQLEQGVEIRDGNGYFFTTAIAKAKILEDRFHVSISINEGKYHQVKRMFSSLGVRVVDLKRVQIGSLVLDERLNEGEYRELSDQEVKGLLDDLGE